MFKKQGKLLAGLTLATCLVATGGALSQQSPSALAETSPTIEIVSKNLSYSDSIYMLYAVDCSGFDQSQNQVNMLFWNSPQAEYTLETAQEVVATSYLETVNGTECIVFYSSGIAAKEMTDLIYCRAYASVDGNDYYSDVEKYSVVDYVYEMRADGDLTVYQESMFADMLDYGASAQNLLGYKTDVLANAEFFTVNVVGGTLSDGFAWGRFAMDSTATLVADPAAEGMVFASWLDENGDSVGASATLGVTVTADATYTATYTERPDERLETEIYGVEASYETVCGVAPAIDATTNSDGEITIAYFEGETQVQPEAFVAGKTYTVKVSVAETATATAAETTATVTVAHGYAWQSNEADWRKMECVCPCGEQKPFYVMDYQSPYVDAENLGIDLSAFVFGANSVTVKSVQQIVRMQDGQFVAAVDGEYVDIDYTQNGMVYSFATDNYEQPSGEYKPYILTLSVVYDIDGVEYSAVVEAKLVDKLIQEADDLKELAYTGAATAGEGGTSNNGYYVLMNDINASELVLPESKLAWQDAIGFRGTFEGNGYTISNLNVKAWTYGLFGAIGMGATIKNVNFTNVVMGDGANLFALIIRKASFANVSVEYSVDTVSSLFADMANDSTFTNVSVKTNAGATILNKLNDGASTELPAGIAVSYYAGYTVTFDTDGGDAIAPVEVTEGKTVAAPTTPVKTSDDYDYEFLGWYYGDEEWDFNNVVTSDMTLVAKWNQVEKAAANVVLNAREHTLSKWDYGNAITVNTVTDETYGAVWTVTVDAVVEQSIKHDAVDVSGYEKVYFYVYNPCASQARLVIHGGYAVWAALTVMLDANAWTLVQVNASVFSASETGGICLMLQDPSGVSIGGEWKISSFYGWKSGDPTPEEPVVPEEPSLPEKQEVAASLLGTVSDSGTTNEYGTVYNLAQEQWFVDNNVGNTMSNFAAGKLAGALPEGYEFYEFYIYNPTDTAYTFHLAGDCSGAWVDSADSFTMAAKAWTKITISNVDIQNSAKGQWYFYVLGGDGKGATYSGWQISTVYACVNVQPQYVEVSAAVLGAVSDSGATNEYGTVYNLTQEQWFVDNNDANTMSSFATGKLAGALPEGYDYFEFWIYNPDTVAHNFHLAGDCSGAWVDSADNFTMAAQAWTKITISNADIQNNAKGQWYMYFQGGGAAVSGWQVSTVYAVKA